MKMEFGKGTKWATGSAPPNGLWSSMRLAPTKGSCSSMRSLASLEGGVLTVTVEVEEEESSFSWMGLGAT